MIERFWTRLDKNTDFLTQYKACLSPDFSQYTDMPRALCIFNQYRRLWLSRYWEDRGIRVIPSVNWSDKESYSYCFDGYPTHTTIAISTLGTIRDKEASYLWSCGFEQAIERLQPKNIILYGKYPDYLKEHNVDCEIIHIPHIMHERLKKLEKRNEKKNEK